MFLKWWVTTQKKVLILFLIGHGVWSNTFFIIARVLWFECRDENICLFYDTGLHMCVHFYLFLPFLRNKLLDLTHPLLYQSGWRLNDNGRIWVPRPAQLRTTALDLLLCSNHTNYQPLVSICSLTKKYIAIYHPNPSPEMYCICGYETAFSLANEPTGLPGVAFKHRET